MSIKRKLMLITVSMMLIPVVLIIILSLLLATVFSVAEPAAELSIISSTATMNPYIVRLVIIWSIIAAAIIIIVGTVIFTYINQTFLKPLENISSALDKIKKGDLSCEFVGSGDEELKRLCASFEELRLQLQKNVQKELIKENDQKILLANIAHDIRTPITSIKGYVEGILDGVADTPEKRDRYLRTIYSKAVTIEQMTENLLIYSKLELGRIEYCRKVIDIIDLISKTADEFSLDFQSSNVELSLLLPSDSVYVIGDDEKLKRVFSNLITNAIKYKSLDASSLEISARLNNSSVIISFSDNGIGISEKELPHIFDGFYRADPSRNSTVKGNGLGLSISKRIINDHKGKIWARSTLGQGTDIMILLPIQSRAEL